MTSSAGDLRAFFWEQALQEVNACIARPSIGRITLTKREVRIDSPVGMPETGRGGGATPFPIAFDQLCP